jgi:hypothetical protein
MPQFTLSFGWYKILNQHRYVKLREKTEADLSTFFHTQNSSVKGFIIILKILYKYLKNTLNFLQQKKPKKCEK